ncbi:POU domain class 2-associating factor 1 [Spinachia spinachia]
MHWEKAPPPGQARSRPYQGVRVRDPVKELLRRKRSLGPVPPPQDPAARDTPSWYARGALVPEVAQPAGDGGPPQGPGWRAPTWSAPEYAPVHAPVHAPPAGAYPPISGHADVYVQTLRPSYAMLTYTHAPLLANFRTVPVAPPPGSAPQMELPDSGLTYLPWAQPVTTIPTVPGQVQCGPVAQPGSPLVHMPLSMSLTTMIPELEEVHHMDSDLEGDPGEEAPSLLDRLLEDQEGEGKEEDKDSYGRSLFLPS